MNSLFIKFIFIFLLILLTIYLIIRDSNKSYKLLKAFKNKIFIANLIIICLFYIFINFIINNNHIKLFNINVNNHKELIIATHQALFGFMIAFFAYMDLIVIPFWFIFLALFIFKFNFI
jgi:hypothetical protein